ncbi:MAG: methylmalonyl-CoA epimerase [Anaerolineaceae bacterium]|jgi:methylmalonyl-CoA/ethylmalonyl-CoA epimerase
MAKVTKINHVAVVVSDVDAALTFWQDAMGIRLHHIEDVPSQKSAVAFLPVGESEVELVKPTSDDSGVAKFLAERGGGMHHLCFEVDDIEGMLQQLKGKGVRLIDEQPKVLPGRKMAFIHPKSTGGVLVELYQVIPE